MTRNVLPHAWYSVACVCFVLFATAFISPSSLLAESVQLEGDFVEGGMVVGQTLPEATVMLDNTHVPVNKNGQFVIGFHRDSPAEMQLQITLPNQKVMTRTLTIAQREYQTQTITGLLQKHVTPDDSVIARIRQDAEKVYLARENILPDNYYLQQWIWPATGIITGVFGSQRILNGKASAPHYGIDIALPEGSTVVTPAAGTIILVDDLYYSGITLMIDHGMGIMSTLLHLQESLVKVGDIVKQAQPVALSGNTGRSTGAHLDWRVNWGNHARIDAALLVPEMPLE